MESSPKWRSCAQRPSARSQNCYRKDREPHRRSRRSERELRRAIALYQNLIDHLAATLGVRSKGVLSQADGQYLAELDQRRAKSDTAPALPAR